MRHSLAKYLMELSILDYNLVHYHPSEISAASLCMSMTLLRGDSRNMDGSFSASSDDENLWDDTMEFYSTYTLSHLQPIMDRLALLVFKSSTSKQKVCCTDSIACVSWYLFEVVSRWH